MTLDASTQGGRTPGKFPGPGETLVGALSCPGPGGCGSPESTVWPSSRTAARVSRCWQTPTGAG